MAELILVTVLLTAVVFWLAHRLNGRLFLGAPLFWLAWLLLELGGWVTENLEILPPLPSSMLSSIYPNHAAAFVGSIVGIFMAKGKAEPDARRLQKERLLARCAAISKSLFWPIVSLTAAFGSLHFIERWSLVDFNAMRLYELRGRVLAEGWSFISRIASYFSIATNVLVILAGTVDGARRRVDRGRLLTLWLCNAPHGLAFGGRGWTLSTLVVYLSAFLLVPRERRRAAPKGVASLALLIAAGIAIFTTLGMVRSREVRPESMLSEVVDHSETPSRVALVSWLSSSLWALGTHSDYVRSREPALGQATFEYFFLKLYQWHAVPVPPRDDWTAWMQDTLQREPTYGFTWCVPPTFVPYFIYDFGEYGSLIATMLFVATAHWLSAQWAGMGLVRHTVAFLAVYGMLGSIQTLFLINSLSVWTIIIALAWEMLASLNARHKGPHVMAT